MLLAACGGDPVGNTSPSTWNDAVNAFIDATCNDATTCTGDDPAQCTTDVTADMAQAKSMLDETGQAQCIQCMNARAQAARDFAITCDMADIDFAAVYAACDLDPSMDYDGDGTPDNDDDEACAGFP